MTEKQIITGNKAIAIFMGKTSDTFPCFFHNPSKFITVNEKASNCFCNCEDYKEMYQNYGYHEEYRWLMPVIERIETLTMPNTIYSSSMVVNIYSHNCDIEYSGYEAGTIVEMQAETKIEAVYKSVIFFIDWYNKQIK